MKKMYSLLVLVLTLLCFNLQAQTPQFYNYNNGTVDNSFPLNQAAGKMIQTLVGPGEFNQPSGATAGNITKFYMRISATYPLGPATYTSFKILFAQDAITTLPTGSLYAGTFDTVYKSASVTLTSAVDTWLMITLDHPYTYNPAQSLIIQIEQCSASGTITGYSLRHTNTTGFNRRTFSTGGCPFTYGGTSAYVANCGIDVSTASPVVNRSLKLATPGVNTAYVLVPFNAGMVGFGNNITIETWIKPGGTTTAATVLNKGAASFDYQLGVSLTTMLPFFRAGSSIATCPFAVTPDVWQHLAVVSNGSTVTFYLNGVAGAPVTLACVLGSSTNEMRIGRGNNDAGSGGLDELRVWSVARTGPEILSNMCNKSIPLNTAGLKAIWHFDSTCVDSVSGWNGTLQGAATYDTMTCPVVTNISGNGSLVPKTYSLSQNYPNPFNPTTNIKFSIPKSGYVEIKIYDILGKEITTLVSSPYQAGDYIVGFNAASLSSGIYFYRLVVNDFVQTRKMTLLK